MSALSAILGNEHNYEWDNSDASIQLIMNSTSKKILIQRSLLRGSAEDLGTSMDSEVLFFRDTRNLTKLSGESFTNGSSTYSKLPQCEVCHSTHWHMSLPARPIISI